MTLTAVGIGVAGAAAIEATWWIRARILGIEPRLWRPPAGEGDLGHTGIGK